MLQPLFKIVCIQLAIAVSSYSSIDYVSPSRSTITGTPLTALCNRSCLFICRQQIRANSLTVHNMSSSPEDQKMDKIPPRQLVQLGMKYFQVADIDESIKLFDKADKAVPDGSLTPYLWQRGISLYYADRFQEGSDQFRYDVKVNPLDVEEIVWDIACQHRSNNAGNSVNKLSLPPGKTDRRKIMGTVYSLYRGDGATEHDLVNAGHVGSLSDEFYSLFYLGLWCESNGESAKAENYMRSAVKTSYAQGRGSVDYMTSVAKVHCELRGWQY